MLLVNKGFALSYTYFYFVLLYLYWNELNPYDYTNLDTYH